MRVEVCVVCVYCVCSYACGCVYQRSPKQLFETFIFQAHGSKLTMQSIKKCVDQGTWALLISRSNADKFADSDQGLQPHMSWDEFWPQVLYVGEVLCWVLITICGLWSRGLRWCRVYKETIRLCITIFRKVFMHGILHSHTHTQHTHTQQIGGTHFKSGSQGLHAKGG